MRGARQMKSAKRDLSGFKHLSGDAFGTRLAALLGLSVESAQSVRDGLAHSLNEPLAPLEAPFWPLRLTHVF